MVRFDLYLGVDLSGPATKTSSYCSLGANGEARAGWGECVSCRGASGERVRALVPYRLRIDGCARDGLGHGMHLPFGISQEVAWALGLSLWLT